MPIPVISVAQMREWEQATWQTGVTEEEVIQRVGARVAETTLALTEAQHGILILAGNGHNGDDARAATPHLTSRQTALLNVRQPEAAITELESRLEDNVHLIVDALFGVGINRPLNQAWSELIDRLNQSQIPILSVDVPSGLNADTGEPMGNAIRATVTLTVGSPKAGLLKTPASIHVGRLEVATDVGLIPCPCPSDLQFGTAQDFHQYPPARTVGQHKGSFGHLVIVAGSLGYHGAAVLAARGAAAARPGLTTLVTDRSVYTPVASQLQSTMVRPWQPNDALPERHTAILFGPGLASDGLTADFKTQLIDLWETSPHPVVVDASALDWLPPRTEEFEPVRLITPHPGEAARLLDTTTQTVQADRISAVRELSARFGGCWVVLKGHHSLVGNSEDQVFLNPTGNPTLAQGGSGDVLAGFLGGLIAQPELQTDPVRTARFAVWQHGAAADRLTSTEATWTIEDLPGALCLTV